MDSRQAVSFFIHLQEFPNAENAQLDSLKNSKTSERLVINGYDQTFGHVTYRHVKIARHPMQATEEWIEKMGNYPDTVNNRRIVMGKDI
jgi:predicted glycosyl hydrolase (DUF1957 family)